VNSWLFKLGVFIVVIAGLYYFWGNVASVGRELFKTVFLDAWLVWLAVMLFLLYKFGHPNDS